MCFSGSQEEVHLLPGQARLFAWADPTGTRQLTWTYAANTGEHSLLKVSFDVNGCCMSCLMAKEAGKLASHSPLCPYWMKDQMEVFSFFKKKFFLMFIYFWESDTEHEWGRSRVRGRHRIWGRVQAPSCQHRARHGARAHKQWDHALSRSQTEPPRHPWKHYQNKLLLDFRLQVVHTNILD